MAGTAKPATGIATAMKFFGKRTLEDGKAQGLSSFRDEWNELSEAARAQLLGGIQDGSLTY